MAARARGGKEEARSEELVGLPAIGMVSLSEVHGGDDVVVESVREDGPAEETWGAEVRNNGGQGANVRPRSKDFSESVGGGALKSAFAQVRTNGGMDDAGLVA